MRMADVGLVITFAGLLLAAAGFITMQVGFSRDRAKAQAEWDEQLSAGQAQIAAIAERRRQQVESGEMTIEEMWDLPLATDVIGTPDPALEKQP